jgi:hypothetical protein
MSEETTTNVPNGIESDGASALRRLIDDVFGGDVGETALALGRDTDQIDRFLAGEEDVDEDTRMKANGILKERLDDAYAKASQSDNQANRENAASEGDAPENSKTTDEPSGGNSPDNPEAGGQSRAQGTYL